MLLILKIAWRNLLKSKVSTTINLIGIAVGLFTSILLLTYVKKQFKTDAYLENYERIYRVERNELGIWLPYKAVESIKENVPDVEQITCFHKSFSSDNILSYNDKNFKLDDVILADPDFFKVFKYHGIYGNLANCLDNPNSIVLCKSQAKKIFEDKNPIGETIKYTTTGYGGGEFMFTVTAVIDDPPVNTSIRFKNIISQTFKKNNQDEYQSSRNWTSSNFITYVLLNENAKAEQVTNTIRTTIKNFKPTGLDENFETYRLNPLKGIYFDKVAYWAVTQNTGKKSIVIILGVVAVLILLIAGINYFNLVLAQSKNRLKAIGTSKIIGAGRFYILSQPLIESIIILVTSLLFAALLTAIVIPVFNNLLDQSLEFKEIFSFKNSGIIILSLSLVVILFGLLPSYYVMRQSAVNSIKGDLGTKKSGNNLKYGLVIFQFVITIGLISCLLIIHRQNQFLLKSDYGVDKDHIYCIQLNSSIKDKADYLEQEFLKNPHVRNIAFGFDYFGDFAQGGTAVFNTTGKEETVEYSEFQVYGNFIDVFHLNLLNGKDFDKISTNDNEIIVNKAFVDKYKNIDIPGSSLTSLYNNKESKIIGVVDDFNYKSKYFPIEPIIFRYDKYLSNVMFININTTSISETQAVISSFQKIWDKTIDIFPFEGEFLSDHYNNIYKSETNFMKIIFSFSFLSILLGCLGLFGISLYINHIRIKEVGIRKVNGARISEILILLNKDFVKWVAIAFVIATPIAYYAMNKWLENFAYKTELSWWIFTLAGVVALGIALLTVSWQSWRAATRNPVEALRYE